MSCLTLLVLFLGLRNPVANNVSDDSNIGVGFWRRNRGVGRCAVIVAMWFVHVRRCICRKPGVVECLRKLRGRVWGRFAAQREQAPSPRSVVSYEDFGAEDQEIAAFGSSYASRCGCFGFWDRPRFQRFLKSWFVPVFSELKIKRSQPAAAPTSVMQEYAAESSASSP